MNDEINKISSVYFLGIGGIGMSAIARFFNSRGVQVSGYDKSESALVKELEDEGMKIHFDEDVAKIPGDVELVVYTPAVPNDHKEFVFFREKGFRIMKRSDVLQIITDSSFNVCIAGTHGKTTTTTMIAHILRHSGYGCTAFLGGISVNYGTNFWRSDNQVCVVEADEYDRSFLKLTPGVAVISAMDPDHLDIYGTAVAIEAAFIEFSNRLVSGGLMISKFGLKRSKELASATGSNDVRRITYSLQNASAGAYAENVQIKNGGYEFDVTINERKIEKVQLCMGGMHNVENAVAAITVASSLDIGNDKIKAAVKEFKGVKRRFEYIIPPTKHGKIVFIDDYAHHPEELRALITGAQTLFPDKTCTIIFQPHLYTRTRDLADGFAEVLSLTDECILLPIYPARELPIPGVTSEMIAEKMENKNNKVLTKDGLMKWIEEAYSKNVNGDFGEVLITAGAGDIDTLVEPIKSILMNIPGV